MYAKRTTSYLLSIHGYPPVLVAIRPLHRQDLSTIPAQERSDELAPGDWCRSPSKTQNKKRGMTIEIWTTVCEIFLSGWRSSQIIWRTPNCLHPHTVLRTQIRNVPRKWYENQGTTVLVLTSQKTKIATSACEPK